MLSSFALTTLSLLPISVNPSSDWQVNTQISSLSYTENNSVYDFVKGNESDYQPGENAFTYDEFSISAQYQGFALSLFYRYEWFLDYSEDAMELYGTTVNGTLIDPNRTYNLSLKTSHINTEGIRLAYMHQFEKVNFYVASAYLKAKELMDGEANGYAELTGSCGDGLECYTGELDLSYTYSEDELFDRQVDAPKSLYGYTFDLGLDWAMSDSWYASLYVQDVFSEILWDESPYTDANATTSTSKVVDGKVKIEPTITGYEGNEDFKQRLPTKYQMALSYQFEPQHLAYLKGFHAYGATLLHVGYQYQFSGSVWGIKLYPEQEALGLEFQHRYMNFSIASKPFDYQESEVIELSLGFQFPF
ncbi:hypothetical protein [Vibrio profundi]|uniref:hypothetical protein n=1 Tax=Vibrio profundi TaxID=1774960 RepID=UPI003736CF4C